MNGDLSLLLPPPDELDALIGSAKWMVRKATAEVLGKNAASSIIEIVGPSAHADEDVKAASADCTEEAVPGGCGSNKLEW